MNQQSFLSWIHEINDNQKTNLGRKASRLAELSQANINIPKGFVVFPQALHHVLEYSRQLPKIEHQLRSIDRYNPADIDLATKRIKTLIETAEFPKEISLKIFEMYDCLGRDVFVSVRGSISADSFSSAHQEPYLNIRGDASVIVYIRKMWAQLVNAHNLKQLIDAETINLPFSVIVEHMINSQVSGVAFTASPDGLDKNHLYINAAYGIRDEYIANDSYPDLYQVDRQQLDIVDKQVYQQPTSLQRINGLTTQMEIQKPDQIKQKLSDKNIKQLSKVIKKIHEQYFFPQRIEWALENDQVYILDTQPISNQDRLSYPQADQAKSSSLASIAQGMAIAPGLVTGPFKTITHPQKATSVSMGDIVYIPNSSFIKDIPLTKVGGVIVAQASRNDPAILYLKSSGTPSIIVQIVKHPQEEQIVTLDATTGELFKGSLPARNQVELAPSQQPETFQSVTTATKIFADVSHPDQISKLDHQHVNGLGLVKGEYLIKSLGYEYKDFTGHNQLQLQNYLCQQLSKFLSRFSSQSIFYRLSDYSQSEPQSISQETRGAINYFLNPQPVVYELEAIFNALASHNHSDFNLVLPLVRAPQEIIQFKKILTPFLAQHHKSPAIWVMIETPSSAILIEDIIKTGIKGVIIGLNDLATYTLASDRKNPTLQTMYNASHSAIRELVNRISLMCHHTKIPCICAGESLENNHQVLFDVIKAGMYGICISPASIDRIKNEVSQIEANIVKDR